MLINNLDIQGQSHIVIAIRTTDVHVYSTQLSGFVPPKWGLVQASFELTQSNFCFVDAVRVNIEIVALHIFLVGDLVIPKYFEKIKDIEIDSPTSFYIWFTPHRVEITDETYISIQDLGERLYQNSKGEWLLVLATDAFTNLSVDTLT